MRKNIRKIFSIMLIALMAVNFISLVSYGTPVYATTEDMIIENEKTVSEINKEEIISIENVDNNTVEEVQNQLGEIEFSEVPNNEVEDVNGVDEEIEEASVQNDGYIEISTIKYQTHVQDYGWQSWKENGQFSGTTGKSKRLEGIKVKVDNIPEGGKISYRTHIQDYGWQGWVENGQVSGTEGESKRLEAIQIKLEGLPSEYHIEYRVHIQDIGWQMWKRDGQLSGTEGQSKRLEAIEIRLVKESVNPSIKYQSHVQDYGWQSVKKDGQTSGTQGESKRVEALKISLENDVNNNSIIYRTHVQDYGWLNWGSNGAVNGTMGESKRIEAIQIKLDKPIDGYTLKYRVHVQDYGWQSWKDEGEIAGTTGKAKRIEAIEIKFVSNINPTIVIDPGHNYGGDDGAYATHNGVTYIERDLNMSVSIKLKRELENKGFQVVLTRNPEDREKLPVKESLSKRVELANKLDADFFISIHHNASESSSAKGVEAYYSSATPLSGGYLLKNGIEINEEENMNKSKVRSSNYKIDTSKKIANNIVNNVTGNMGLNNRGVYDDDFYVVKNTHMPSVLFECGYITNPDEAKLLLQEWHQQKMAEIIATEIYNIFK